MSSNNMVDPKRQNKILRYKPPSTESNPTLEDPTPDYMNLLGMIFSMCGLMLKIRLVPVSFVPPPRPVRQVLRFPGAPEETTRSSSRESVHGPAGPPSRQPGPNIPPGTL
ncbi:hypothetical protein NHX12_017575 [Muraenolepis orangiensis]|uniref:PAT complex subunit Asterix n=1 Tax=Muraenolepis orangiensis TaxID=630683 RepID=A0A9Q0EYR0_9TELE|nr:hypothetical protein NHX12_017575 [Muraenolepis orangiensis]